MRHGTEGLGSPPDTIRISARGEGIAMSITDMGERLLVRMLTAIWRRKDPPVLPHASALGQPVGQRAGADEPGDAPRRQLAARPRPPDPDARWRRRGGDRRARQHAARALRPLHHRRRQPVHVQLLRRRLLELHPRLHLQRRRRLRRLAVAREGPASPPRRGAPRRVHRLGDGAGRPPGGRSRTRSCSSAPPTTATR